MCGSDSFISLLKFRGIFAAGMKVFGSETQGSSCSIFTGAGNFWKFDFLLFSKAGIVLDHIHCN